MDLSINPLEGKQKEYLDSDSDLFRKNLNKSQYRTDIAKHLGLAIRYFYHILPKSHFLKKQNIYDQINAQTLEDNLQVILKDVEDSNPYKSYFYDFRTIELARLFFEISIQYLTQNPYLKVDDELPGNIKESTKTVSDFYKMLSNIAIQSESFQTIKEKNVIKLEKKLKEIQKEIENTKKTGSKYDIINQKHSKLSDIHIKLDDEYHELQSNLTKIQGDLKKVKERKTKKKMQNLLDEIKTDMGKNREQGKPITQKIFKLQEDRTNLVKSLQEQQDELFKILRTKYEHLKPYFCMLNKLPEAPDQNTHKPQSENSSI